jgi:hypothetical protein
MEINEERIIEVELEIGGEEYEDELDIEQVVDFLQELKQLCNAYNLVLVGCDCGMVVVSTAEKQVEDYEINGDHIWPVYAHFVNAA